MKNKLIVFFKSKSRIKLFNAILFVVFSLISEIVFCMIVNKIFLPTYFFLDLFILIILASIILFFERTKFDMIYLSIISLLYTLMYGLNVAFYVIKKGVFTLSDLSNIASLFLRTRAHSKEFPVGLFLIFIIIFIVFEFLLITINIIVYNKQKSTNENKKKKRALLLTLTSLFLIYSSSLAITCYCEKNNNNDVSNIEYSSYYNSGRFGLTTFYLIEIFNKIFPKKLSDEEIFKYFKNSNYLKDDFTELLTGYNVINILFETGQTFLVNPKTMPNLSFFLENGINMTNCYSANNTFPSEMLCLIGHNPSFLINTKNKYNFPNAIGNNLKNFDYNTFFYCDYFEDDGYNQKPLMERFGFDNLRFDDYFDKQKKTDECHKDSIVMPHIINDIKSSNKPFYMHWTSYFTHQPYNNNDHNGLYIELNREFGKDLDKYENNGEWENKLDYLKLDYPEINSNFRNMTLASMDFDKSLGILKNYLLSNPEIAEKTILVIYGDHQAGGKLINDFRMTENVNKTQNDFYNIKNFKTIGLIWNPKLNNAYNKKFGNRNFDLFTTPMNIYPTLMDLLGIKFNPKLCQGKSIFDDSYSNEVFYSQCFQIYLNTNSLSDNGSTITRNYKQNDLQKDFINKMNQIKEQMTYLDKIYTNGLFEKYDYKHFMPA